MRLNYDITTVWPALAGTRSLLAKAVGATLSEGRLFLQFFIETVIRTGADRLAVENICDV